MQVCNNIPTIVYQNSWLSQTSAIGSSGSPQSLYTFSSTGQYRVSITLEVVSSSGSPTVTLHFWPEYAQVAGVQANPSSPMNDVSSGSSFSLVASSGQIADFYTVISGSGLSYYNLYITIEQLQ